MENLRKTLERAIKNSYKTSITCKSGKFIIAPICFKNEDTLIAHVYCIDSDVIPPIGRFYKPEYTNVNAIDIKGVTHVEHLNESNYFASQIIVL